MKALLELLEKLDTNKIIEKFHKKLEEAMEEECTISIVKSKGGKATTHIEGSYIAILLTLAGLEKSVLEKLDFDAEMFDFLKSLIGNKEVD